MGNIFQVINVLMSNAYISGSGEEEETDATNTSAPTNEIELKEDKNDDNLLVPVAVNPERTPKPAALQTGDDMDNDATGGIVGIGGNDSLLAPANAGLPGHTPEPTPDHAKYGSPDQFSPEPDI